MLQGSDSRSPCQSGEDSQVMEVEVGVWWGGGQDISAKSEGSRLSVLDSRVNCGRKTGLLPALEP